MLQLILVYILKSTICLSVFYWAYRYLLAKETFFGFNRIVLLLGIVASLALPNIEIEISPNSIIGQSIFNLEKLFLEKEYQKDEIVNNQNPLLVEDISALEAYSIQNHTASKEVEINHIAELPPREIPWLLILSTVYLIGFLINLGMLAISYYKMKRLIKYGEKTEENNIILVSVDAAISPFSWAKYIVLPKIEQEDVDTILLHETAHIQHKHYLDILFTELILVFHWFNPFAWKLKQELKDIHEYQADNKVINSGIETTQYQLLILKKAVGSSSYALANSFNHSKIKKRITMMLKQKSRSRNRLKFLFLVPIAMLSVYAFAYSGLNLKSESSEKAIENEILRQEDDSLRRVYHIPIKNKDSGKNFEYGMRLDPIYNTMRMHYGKDYEAPEGTTIYAIKDGEVVEATTNTEGYGKIVKIVHGNEVETWYAHNSENLVKKGDKIKTGQAIALVGNTGKSKNPHLHFEVKVHGISIDPKRIYTSGSDIDMLSSEFFNYLYTPHTLAHPIPTYKGEPSGYGMRIDPTTGNHRMHTGLDFAAAKGDTIYALKNGIVSGAEESTTGMGNQIKLRHADEMETKYAHCDKILVGVGQLINAGQAIALVGSTGIATGPHLHLEIRVKDVLQNPLTLIRSIKAKTSNNIASEQNTQGKYKVCIDATYLNNKTIRGVTVEHISTAITKKLQEKLLKNNRMDVIMTSDYTKTNLTKIAAALYTTILTSMPNETNS